MKLKPEIAVAPLANRVKPDDDWVPMDKESMAKFKEKRSAATTEKVEDAIPPLRTSKLKPVLSPLNVESVLAAARCETKRDALAPTWPANSATCLKCGPVARTRTVSLLTWIRRRGKHFLC